MLLSFLSANVPVLTNNTYNNNTFEHAERILPEKRNRESLADFNPEYLICRVDNLRIALGNKKPANTVRKPRIPVIPLIILTRLKALVSLWTVESDRLIDYLEEKNARELRNRAEFGTSSFEYLPSIRPKLQTYLPAVILAQPQPKPVVRENVENPALLTPKKAIVRVAEKTVGTNTNTTKSVKIKPAPQALYCVNNTNYYFDETIDIAGERDVVFQESSVAEDYQMSLNLYVPNQITAGETFTLYIVVQNKEKYVESSQTSMITNFGNAIEISFGSFQPYETKTYTRYITIEESGMHYIGANSITKVDGTNYPSYTEIIFDVVSNGITITPEIANLNLGETQQFSATGSNLMWTAYGPCSTTQSGLLTPLSTGRCYLRVSNGLDYSIAFIRVYDAGGYTISGKITDIFSEVDIAGADLEIDGKTVSTNENGNFETTVSSPGYYEVTIRQNDYTPFHTWAFLEEGQDLEINYQLIPADFDWQFYNQVHRNSFHGKIKEIEYKYSTMHWKIQPNMIIFNDTSRIDPTNPYEDITKTVRTARTNLKTILPKYNPRDANPDKVSIEQTIRKIDGEFAVYWDNDLNGIGLAAFIFDGPIIDSCAAVFIGGAEFTADNFLYNQEIGTCFGAVTEPYNLHQPSVFAEPYTSETYSEGDLENAKVYLTRSRIHYRNGPQIQSTDTQLPLEDQDYEARPDIVEIYYGENSLKSASLDKTFVYKDGDGVTHSYDYYEVPEDVKAMFPTMF